MMFSPFEEMVLVLSIGLSVKSLGKQTVTMFLRSINKIMKVCVLSQPL